MAFTKTRKNYRKRAYKPRARKPRAKRSGVSLAVKSYVNKSIHRQIENKTISDKDELEFASYTASSTMVCQPIHPTTATMNITQGVGQGQRVGNTITTRKLLLKYIIYPLPYSASNNPWPQPCEVMVWIGFLKGNRQTQPAASDFLNYFQNGNASQNPASNLWDCLLPVNTDLFTICKSFRHKLGNEFVRTSDDLTLTDQQQYSNNDFKLNVERTVDVTKYINKVLKYDDTSGTPDTGLYMWMTAVNASGTTNVSNLLSHGMRYVMRYDYEDA